MLQVRNRTFLQERLGELQLHKVKRRMPCLSHLRRPALERAVYTLFLHVG